MIHRIAYEDWQLIFPIAAFLVATMVYAAAWRAPGMKPAEAGRRVASPPNTEQISAPRTRIS